MPLAPGQDGGLREEEFVDAPCDLTDVRKLRDRINIEQILEGPGHRQLRQLLPCLVGISSAACMVRLACDRCGAPCGGKQLCVRHDLVSFTHSTR